MKRIVFLAGTKSHGPGDHEYEKGLRLFARALAGRAACAVYLDGWPDEEKALDRADAIVVYADGSDHRESDHPLLLRDRLSVLERQLKRGCGFVALHYATFAPLGRAGDLYQEYLGGHFDYQSGPGANHWASAISRWDSTTQLPDPQHPVCRGVRPFSVNEEWYYRMRLHPDAKPLLTVVPPGESAPQTVAWRRERRGGGRGFACTGGHAHKNWANPDYQRLIAQGILWAAHASGPPAYATLDDPLRVTILTGHHHPAHDWRATTAALEEVFARDSRVKVTVWTDPEQLARAPLNTDVLLVNYCNWESPTLSRAARQKLLRFVRQGGGLFLLHFANGAWRDWPEYSGGLSRRVWIDGKANHDVYGPFTVKLARPDHPFTRGLTDFLITDELYCSQVGSKPIEPLLTARSKLTNTEEPLAYAYTEGQGRIFQTLLGHDAGAVRAPAHAEVLRRALAWCAHRELLPLL